MRPRFLAVLALVGCGHVEGQSPDATPPPDAAGVVDAATIDAMPPPAPPPSGIGQTAGGGVTSSTSHRMHVRIGAPEPLGRAQSSGHRITTGPGAMPWASDGRNQ